MSHNFDIATVYIDGQPIGEVTGISYSEDPCPAAVLPPIDAIGTFYTVLLAPGAVRARRALGIRSAAWLRRHRRLERAAHRRAVMRAHREACRRRLRPC